MRRAARAALLTVSSVLLLVPRPVGAAESRGVVFLFLLGGLSYEEALSQPTFRALSAKGGIGLMTTPSRDLRDNSAYLSLGAGAVMNGSQAPVLVPEEGVRILLDDHVVDAHGGDPGALAEALADAEVGIEYDAAADRDAPGLLVVADGAGRVPPSFFLGHPIEEGAPDVRLVVADFPREDLDGLGAAFFVSQVLPFAALAEEERLLVVVASPAPSATMIGRGDIAPPLIVAELDPEEVAHLPLFPIGDRDPGNPQPEGSPGLTRLDGAPRGLTSGTTRRRGVVSVADVAPTILEFLGVPVPEEMTGSPIRIEAEAPTDLHARFLEYQRVRVPVQAALMALLLAAVAAGLVLLYVPAPSGVRTAVTMAGISAASIPIVLLGAGYLPTFSYPVLVGFLVAGLIALPLVAWWLGRRQPAGPLVALAWIGLVTLVADALLGWRGMVLSLLGGDALQGVRFYGLSNPYAGFLLAAAVLGATRLPLLWGVALLVGAATLGGAPMLGANLGAGITLAAAAGLWVAVGARDRLGLREIAVGAVAAAAGLGLILIWHALAPDPTHVSRVASEVRSSGPAALVAAAGRRLQVLIRNTTAMPAAWLTAAGLPFGLAIALRRPRPFRALLDRDPRWRWGVAILALSGMVGFLVNDTSSTAAVAFGYVGLGLVFPSLEARWATKP
ncbi:MAG: hypothetical protein ACRDIX_00320 [Actinomycetota bacterium]